MKVLLVFMALLCSLVPAMAQEQELFIAPQPQPDALQHNSQLARIVAYPFVSVARTVKGAVTFKDKQASILASVEAGFLISDGITTRQFVKLGEWEADPIARTFIGREPTWGRMAPWGAVQDLGTYALSTHLHRSHTWARHIWWLPEAVGIAGNAYGTFGNIQTTK